MCLRVSVHVCVCLYTKKKKDSGALNYLSLSLQAQCCATRARKEMRNEEVFPFSQHILKTWLEATLSTGLFSLPLAENNQYLFKDIICNVSTLICLKIIRT